MPFQKRTIPAKGSAFWHSGAIEYFQAYEHSYAGHNHNIGISKQFCKKESIFTKSFTCNLGSNPGFPAAAAAKPLACTCAREVARNGS